VLGEARDTEVRRDRLDEAVSSVLSGDLHLDPEANGLRRALLASSTALHRRAHKALREALVSDRYLELLEHVHDLVADPPWLPAADQTIRRAYLPRLTHDLDRLRRRMVLAQDETLDAASRGALFHRARRAAKRARYAAEPLRPVYGEPAVALVERLKELQTALGNRQDTVVTRAYLLGLTRSRRRPIDPVAAVVVGALVEREARDAARYEAESLAAWHGVATADRLG
jgi:CHAD domain-containing protein